MSTKTPFETWDVGAGVCMTLTAFADAAAVPPRDVVLAAVDWSDETPARCLYLAEEQLAKPTVDGVALMLKLLTNDEERTGTILRRLANIEAHVRRMRASEPQA